MFWHCSAVVGNSLRSRSPIRNRRSASSPADVEVDQLRLTFVHTNASREDILVPVTTPQGSGGAFFFGFIDRGNPFTAVEFHNDGGQPDGFHFDDLTIAPPEQVCPDPAMLAIGLYAGIDVYGADGVTYRVEYTTDLPFSPTTNWTVLTNIFLPWSPYFYVDRESVASREKVLSSGYRLPLKLSASTWQDH